MHSKPVIFVVGADKGGVGKTTVTRAFLDFLDARGVSNRAFDTENEVAEGVRKRFFPERTEIVNLRDSDDQMKVFDTISGATATVIDVRAGLLSPTRKLLEDIGFLDPSRFGITIMHVPATTRRRSMSWRRSRRRSPACVTSRSSTTSMTPSSPSPLAQ